jgi:adenine-specific DNA-methyltransferase
VCGCIRGCTSKADLDQRSSVLRRSDLDCAFLLTHSPPTRSEAVLRTSRAYSAHVHGHLAIAAARIREEERALRDEDHLGSNTVYKRWQTLPKLPSWNGCVISDATLFRDTFSGSYFGLSQAIEVDALRYSIDLAMSKQLINIDQHRWLILALCVALSRCATSTGHFAQPLTAKQSNIKRFLKQRSRSIRDAWLDAIEGLTPVGTPNWRRHNRAFRGDALLQLDALATAGQKPAVVYADPPYTNDQYSRYYHVYDTLILYDYPCVSGRGLYRPDRAISSFSLATAVQSSIECLIRRTATIGADLIITYPTDGLLRNSREILPEIIKAVYGRKPAIREITHHHSTMGGSKGTSKQLVTEVIYRAYY